MQKKCLSLITSLTLSSLYPLPKPTKKPIKSKNKSISYIVFNENEQIKNIIGFLSLHLCAGALIKIVFKKNSRKNLLTLVNTENLY